MTPDMPYDDPHDDGGTNTDSIMPTDNQQEIINTIALTRINYFSLNGMLELYRRLGSATAVMEHRNDIRDIVPEASPRLADALKDMSGPLRIAEAELRYDEEHDITPLTMNDTRYPSRLRECGDAPLMLFYKGNADLNRTRVLSIVGTRHCTAYGQDLIRRFCDDLRQICPDVLIISGLAYGVDICAHRNALRTGFDTAAVLAHGLDTVYPSSHRETACEMTSHGGLITEFLTQTNADKVNFVRRNRIVAGMADATLLVESGAGRRTHHHKHCPELRQGSVRLPRSGGHGIQRRVQQTHTRQRSRAHNLRRRPCRIHGMGQRPSPAPRQTAGHREAALPRAHR